MTPVLVLAGTDTSGGAGLAADVAAITALGGTCQSITTATVIQDDHGLQEVRPVEVTAVITNLKTRLSNCTAKPIIKLGMLPQELITPLAQVLAAHNLCVIADPVMGPSAGGTWATAKWLAAWTQELAPLIQLATPNLTEANRLANTDNLAQEQVAQALLDLGIRNVIVTGGDLADAQLSNDFFLSDKDKFWLNTSRHAGTVRGTGCTFTSSITTYLARDASLLDAIICGHMYTAAYIAKDKTPHPNAIFLPWVSNEKLTSPPPPTKPLTTPLGVCAIVAAAKQIPPLVTAGVTSVQLRLPKQLNDDEVGQQIAAAVNASAGINLFINDYWQVACANPTGITGVHLGQEDLQTADLAAITKADLCIGVSAHNWYEAAVAAAIAPAYISFGPVFPTTSKQVTQPPLGPELLTQLCTNLPVPTVAIGGINAENLASLEPASLSGIATITATQDVTAAKKLVAAWNARN